MTPAGDNWKGWRSKVATPTGRPSRVRGLGRTGEQGAVTQVDSVEFPKGQNVVPDCLGNPVTSSEDREVQRFRSHS